MHGFATSVRLENIYWTLLEEIARRDNLSVAEILARLYEELLDAHGAVDNFASFLRVCCALSDASARRRNSGGSDPADQGARRQSDSGA
jgi:predicted DNA-binding ribbon-helix-helix protein